MPESPPAFSIPLKKPEITPRSKGHVTRARIVAGGFSTRPCIKWSRNSCEIFRLPPPDLRRRIFIERHWIAFDMGQRYKGANFFILLLCFCTLYREFSNRAHRFYIWALHSTGKMVRKIILKWKVKLFYTFRMREWLVWCNCFSDWLEMFCFGFEDILRL